MPRSVGNQPGVQVSVVLSPRLFGLVRERAEQLGSQADAIREAVDAHFTLFGLPDLIADRLREDAKSQNKDMAGYIRELLAHRYEEVMNRRPAKK